MTKILVIDSSSNPGTSVSRELANELLEGLKAKSPNADITYHDVAKNPFPFMDTESIGALFTPEDQRNEQQKERVALSDKLIKEAKEADHLIISAPMYNLTIPAQLKTWIDQIVIAGKTFQYNEDGSATGLVDGANINLYIVCASGGTYEGEVAAYNFQSPYLAGILGFLGFINQKHIFAQGLNQGDEKRAAGIAAAKAQVAEILA